MIPLPSPENTAGSRRPDGRALRETKTYLVAELAEAAGKTPATVRQWIAEGLPTIDDGKPAMVFGWVAKDWLGNKWAARLRPAPPGAIYCFGCRAARYPIQDSVRFVPRKGGSMIIQAKCSDCGAAMHRSIKLKDMAGYQEALSGEAKGFVESSTMPYNPLVNADSLPSSGKTATTPQPPPRERRSDRFPQNAHNERLKRAFFEYRREAEGHSEDSIRKDERALLHLETCFGFRDFGGFSKQDAIKLKDYLRSRELRPPVKIAILSACRAFISFLALRPGFRRKIGEQTLRYLNFTTKERRSVVQAESIRPSPTPAEVDRTITAMPLVTMIDKHNRAAMALLGLTFIRIGALVSLRVKHLDFELGAVHQPATEVNTKFSKDQHAIFVPFFPYWIEILRDWLSDLRSAGFGDDDPLFPRSEVDKGKSADVGDRQLSKSFMSDTQVFSRIIPGAIFCSKGSK